METKILALEMSHCMLRGQDGVPGLSGRDSHDGEKGDNGDKGDYRTCRTKERRCGLYKVGMNLKWFRKLSVIELLMEALQVME